MNYKEKGFGVGAFTGLAGITAYWITQAMAYTEMTCVISAAVTAGVFSLCFEVIWECEQEKKHRKAVKRAVKRAIERFMEDTERDYLVIPRRCEEVHMHKWKTEEPEEQKEPIRKVKGALAEDFAKAPEEVKREMFG